MNNIKAYELFLEDLNQDLAMRGVEDVHTGQGTYDYLTLTGKFQKAIPQNLLAALRGFHSAQWKNIGPIIDKINYLLEISEGLSWEDYLGVEALSKISDPIHLDEASITNLLKGILNRVLDDTIFKGELAKGKWDKI
jgi:hypothetical protein